MHFLPLLFAVPLIHSLQVEYSMALLSYSLYIELHGCKEKNKQSLRFYALFTRAASDG